MPFRRLYSKCVVEFEDKLPLGQRVHLRCDTALSTEQACLPIGGHLPLQDGHRQRRILRRNALLGARSRFADRERAKGRRCQEQGHRSQDRFLRLLVRMGLLRHRIAEALQCGCWPQVRPRLQKAGHARRLPRYGEGHSVVRARWRVHGHSV